MKIDNYKPDYLVEAVYQLDPKRLQALNVRAVMVDLDNTLIEQLQTAHQKLNALLK